MEEIYQNLSVLDQWASGSSGETSLDATDLWLDEASGTIHASHHTVEAGAMARWLAQHTRAPASVSSPSSPRRGAAQSLVQRFIWVDVHVKDKAIRLSPSAQDVLLDSLGLKLAYAYSRSIISGATAFPPRSSNPDLDQRAYSFCYMPKIAALWSHRRPSGPSGPPPVTQCVMFVQAKEKQALKQGLNMSWGVDICRSPMFPALVLGLLLGTQIDQSNGGIKVQLRKVEKRTGHHTFASREDEEAATEELGELSAQTSGSAAKLASTMRKTQTLERLLDFIPKTLDEDAHRLRQHVPEGNDLLRCYVHLLKERQKNQLLDTEYILKRVRVQVDALFSIITQKDSLHNLRLSQSTHYRDSTSMKTLAVVTMFFLPGSFISALFSTPCFEWASVDHRSSRIAVTPTPQFSLYWAITIPLTAATFALYFVWLWFQKSETDGALNGKASHLQTEAEMGEAEGPSLARTRRQTLWAKRRPAFGSLAHEG